MLRILIIDDVETNRFVLRNIITDMGYQPVLAENGKQGLKIMERIVPDLILLDVAMPEMDGFEFADIIQKDVKTRNIPIIFISAFDAPQDIVKGFAAGLSKNFLFFKHEHILILLSLFLFPFSSNMFYFLFLKANA